MDIRNNATFTFFKDFNDGNVETFAQDLINWSQKDSSKGKPLQILLNSGGGGALSGLAFYALIGELRLNGHKVTVKVVGRAGSAACIALQAADRRIIAPNSDLLVHAVIPISHGSGTTHAETQWELDRCQDLTDRTMGILVKRSRGKVDMARIMSETKDKMKDWWVNSTQALELGLVDEIESPPAFEDEVESSKALS